MSESSETCCLLGSLVRPPEGLGTLDALAWTIGRDDAAAGLPPVRCMAYRADKGHRYLDGYEAQRSHEAKALGMPASDRTSS